MHTPRTLQTLAACALAAALTACGGGGGGGGDGTGGTGGGTAPGPSGGGTAPSGTGVSYGVVQGFGSVIVNGVHYDDRGVDIVVDDRTVKGDGGSATQTNLRVGMLVRVDFDSASSVKAFTVDAGLSGRVEAVLDDNRVVVMGQTVRINDDTLRYEDNVPRPGLVPAVGDHLRLHGWVAAPGVLSASFVQKVSAAPGPFQAKGVVSAHNGSTTFSVGGLTVTYTGATVTADMPSGSWNGLLVEVKGSCSGTAPAPCGTLAASKVQPTGPLVAGSTNKAQAEFEGVVLAGTAASFKLGNQSVTTDASTRWTGGAAADLAVGVKVEAEGPIVAGVLKATKVAFRDGARAEGDIASVATASGSFTLAGLPGITVRVNSLTEWKNTSGLAALGPGNHLRIRGRLAGSTLTATEVELRSASRRVELQAAVTAVAPPSLTLAGGVTINTTTLSDSSFLGLNDAVVGRSAFFAAAKAGTLVKVRGDLTGGSVSWSELQLESD